MISPNGQMRPEDTARDVAERERAVREAKEAPPETAILRLPASFTDDEVAAILEQIKERTGKPFVGRVIYEGEGQQKEKREL